MKLGLISDTHGLLRPEAIAALQGCDWIVHAGDVGRPEILDSLRAIAPVTAVRGNIDTATWAESLPETAEAVVGRVRLYVLHDVHTLRALPPRTDVVVSGHSHKHSKAVSDGILYVNPGSAGPRRFKLPITVARMDLAHRPLRVEFVVL